MAGLVVLGATLVMLVIRNERARQDQRLTTQGHIYAMYARDLAPTTTILEGLADDIVSRFPLESGTAVRIFAPNGVLLSTERTLGDFPSRAVRQHLVNPIPFLALPPPTRHYVAQPIGDPAGMIGVVEVSADNRALRRWQDQLVLPLLQASALAMLGAALLAWLLARTLLQPLQALRHVASAIAAGDLQARSHDRSTDEIGKLGNQINQMAAELDARFKEIERLATTRRDFYRAVSHELRTPLTAIRGIAENLEESVASEDQRSLAIIQEETERLQRLIDELLAEGSAVSLTPRRSNQVDIAALVRDVIALMRDRAVRAGVRLRANPLGPDVAAVVEGDRDRLKQALINLIDNALKWTPPGGDVGIRYGVRGMQAPADVVLTVSDTGPGVPAELRESVWQRGSRGPDGGQGLGLALVKEVVTAHGGAVRLLETPHTTIEIVLPAVTPR